MSEPIKARLLAQRPIPRVTFLVPTYNYGRFLATCVHSILGQSFTDLEVLILDDGSTDDTHTVAQKLAKSDNRVFYIRHDTNLGHIANYNWGIHHAKGELTWLISADDALANSTILETFVRQFDEHPTLGFCFSRVQCIDDSGTPYQKFIPNPNTLPITDQSGVIEGKALFKPLLNGNFVPAPGALTKTACYTKYGLFQSALTHSGDWYNWLVFSLDSDVYYHAEPAVYYRKHPNNMHQTYQNPQFALDNSLLCLETLEVFLCSHGYPDDLILAVENAQRGFKAKHRYPMSFTEQCQQTLLKAKQTLHLA